MREQEDSFFLATGEDANAVHDSLNTHTQMHAPGRELRQQIMGDVQHLNLPAVTHPVWQVFQEIPAGGMGINSRLITSQH